MRIMLISTGFIFGMIGNIHAQAIHGNITAPVHNRPIEGVTVYLSRARCSIRFSGNFSFNSVRLMDILNLQQSVINPEQFH
jgi:hypothetical protein